MANDLAILESQLVPLAPHFAQVLGNRMPVERLTRTILISCERAPKLLGCDRQSLFNAAMSAAVLGLEVDGVSGQAFLIPFKERAQLVIGYKGYNTMGARSGYTITGACVREGDTFEYELGTSPYVRHRPRIIGGRITHAYATATSLTLTPIVSVLSIDDIIAIKNKSPGAKKPDSPWNEPAIGFPAMAEKSAKRRLARSMPLNIVQLAARLEEAFDEQGNAAWIHPERGVQIDGEVLSPESSTPTAQDILGSPTPVQPASTAGEAVFPSNSASPASALEEMAREAASRGQEIFTIFWKGCSPDDQHTLEAIGPELRRLINAAGDQGAQA